jgi:hypothetical protein
MHLNINVRSHRAIGILVGIFAFLSLFQMNSFAQDCTSTLACTGEKENCLQDSPDVCKWNAGYSDNESRVIAFDVTGTWVLNTTSTIDIVLKAGQIPCTISSIIGPECTGNCTITNLIDAPGAALWMVGVVMKT